jgi:hypothetical protein
VAHGGEEGAVFEGSGIEVRALAGGEETTKGGQSEAGLAQGEAAEGDAAGGPEIGVAVEAGAAEGTIAQAAEGVALGVGFAGRAARGAVVGQMEEAALLDGEEKEQTVDEAEELLEVCGGGEFAGLEAGAEGVVVLGGEEAGAESKEGLGDAGAEALADAFALILAEGEPMQPLTRSIERMGRRVSTRLRDVLDAYTASELDRAVAVWQTDDEVDEHYNALFRELLTYMMGDPRTIGACTHLLFMAKNLERIGDHATNIAETVHYEITGEDIVGERPRAQPTAEDSDPTPNLSTH